MKQKSRRKDGDEKITGCWRENSKAPAAVGGRYNGLVFGVWDELVAQAAHCYQVAGLGGVGLDVAA
jgi:hypothetical protein